jgi:hypothetical protein
VGYIIVAMKEDQSETTEKKKPESQKYKKRGDEYV